jgi:hypothetical protein
LRSTIIFTGWAIYVIVNVGDLLIRKLDNDVSAVHTTLLHRTAAAGALFGLR